MTSPRNSGQCEMFPSNFFYFVQLHVYVRHITLSIWAMASG